MKEFLIITGMTILLILILLALMWVVAWKKINKDAQLNIKGYNQKTRKLNRIAGMIWVVALSTLAITGYAFLVYGVTESIAATVTMSVIIFIIFIPLGVRLYKHHFNWIYKTFKTEPQPEDLK